MRRKVPGKALFLFLCILLPGIARAADLLDEVFQQVDGTPWGVGQESVRNAVGASLFDEQGIIVVPWNLSSSESTCNFLFNKDGGLYNLAWYATIPVADIQRAEALEGELVRILRGRYGKPSYTFSDGNIRKSGKVAREAPRKAAGRKKLAQEIVAKKNGGRKQSVKEDNADLMRLMLAMPTIFYSKMAFWDAGPVWAYTNLLCSTDGDCYLHLQFVSKDLTRGEKYFPTPDKAFSYSPLDRDQDLATRANRTWRERRNPGQGDR